MDATLTRRAQVAADKFNAKHGVELLRVVPFALTTLDPKQIDQLRALNMWVTTRTVFELLYARTATHGELINLGHQLKGPFERRKLGATAYYFVAPAGTTPPTL